ncbi:MAG: pyridoxamine 5'-phosphate oxidase family protein [Bacteroidota bacterium]|nr:pyridoxamine 5'-phosphate oxidase family protein [Bacteroidota bacterium]
MGKIVNAISDDLQKWIEAQKLFFVATAPLLETGHINLSPKGLDSFRIINPALVAYQDLTGSGVETIAHVKENKRIVIMFCAFNGPPKIIRLYGEGEILIPGEQKFENYCSEFPSRTGTRAIILIHLTRIQDSCGYGVPLYEFVSDREVLTKWADVKGEQGVLEYQKTKNVQSIDGLPGLL